jgi:hypothetical protein
MNPPLKLTIKKNVRALLGVPDGKSGVSLLISKGVPHGTAQRVLDESTGIGVEVLERVAEALGVDPWQLCVPELDPARLPSTEPASFRWPFRQIDPDVITGLVGTAAQGVENGLLASLATIGISPRKQRKTGT